MDPLTYRAAGVDIRAGDEAVRRIAPLAASTHRPEVLGGIGSFAAFCRVPFGYQDPVLVSSTDGVGTKLKIAVMADRHDTIGLDLVAMGVNDLLVHGAEPLFFLDYLAVHRIEPARIEAIVAGIAAGCRQAGCALVGGETAEMGAFYAPGEYDLAGFAVGVAERSALITGEHVTVGDRIFGLASSGLHSNGYTLAREAIFGRMGLKLGDPIPGVGRGVGDELLEPTRIYVKPVLGLIRQTRVKAMAHITGGGITENLPRVLPAQRRARIDRRAWPEPPIFAAIQRAAAVDDVEMRRTFNMGIGFVLIVAPDDVVSARRQLEAAGERVYEIGEIVPGAPGVDYV
ncbi:MAG: phosphoribosylformylglycinamidine cyclo-ligase [Candidatus Rokuibacteriota bacterium]